MQNINDEAIRSIGWALSPPLILLTALNVPSVFYANYASRTSTLVAIAAASASVIFGVKVDNPSVAFMTGLLECWIVIWASVLLLRFNPPADFARLRYSKAPRSADEYAEGERLWQRYPQRFSLARLSWTLDLAISFRRVGWSIEKGMTSGLQSVSVTDASSSTETRQGRRRDEAPQGEAASWSVPCPDQSRTRLPHSHGRQLDVTVA